MTKSDEILNILLTNDDGINAEGLWALHHALSVRHRVTVVAPDRERSAVGHGITLKDPIRASQVSVNGDPKCWAVSGTPADCVKLALLELLNHQPDMVISGINPGANVGINLNYSGTVAAAKEATQYGRTALAVSIQHSQKLHYAPAAKFIADLVPLVYNKRLPAGTFLNINMPNLPKQHRTRIRLSHQGLDLFEEYFDKRLDPRDGVYYWQGSVDPPAYADSNADGAVLGSDFISITPVKCDMTDYRTLASMKSWDL